MRSTVCYCTSNIRTGCECQHYLRKANQSSDGIRLVFIWIGGGAPAGSEYSDLDASVAWIEAHGAPGAPQPIPHREGGWALCNRYAMNSQSRE